MGFVSYREDNEEKQDDGSNSMTDSSNLINELAEYTGEYVPQCAEFGKVNSRPRIRHQIRDKPVGA